jgi:hypothetical protein
MVFAGLSDKSIVKYKKLFPPSQITSDSCDAVDRDEGDGQSIAWMRRVCAGQCMDACPHAVTPAKTQQYVARVANVSEKPLIMRRRLYVRGGNDHETEVVCAWR